MPREPHWLEQRYKDLFPKRLQQSNGERPHVGALPGDVDRYAAAALKGVISDLRKATEGERNNQLNKSAYRLGRLIGGLRLDETLAREFLMDTARAIGLERAETDRTIQSGIEAGKQDPFTLDGNDYTEATVVAVDNKSDVFSLAVDWHVTLDPNRIDSTDWLIEDIVERGQLCVLYAPPKTHKSLIVQWLCAQLAQQSTVLYIDFENTEKDLFRRFGKPGMQWQPDKLKNLIYLQFPPLPPLDTVAGGAQLLVWVEQAKPDLVVIDTTSRVVSGPENDSDTFRALYNRTLVYIKALGIATLRIDHSGKDVQQGQRGSSAKNDDVDAVWQLIQQDDHAFLLRCTHQRTGHHPETIPLRKEIEPLRFVRLETVAVPTGPLNVGQLIAEMDRLGVPVSVTQKDIHHYVLNLGLKATQRDAKAAQAYRIDRKDQDALVLADWRESDMESKIESLDQQLSESERNHAVKKVQQSPAPHRNHIQESLGITIGPGVVESPESLTGGAISPPVIPGLDTHDSATALRLLGKNVSVLSCSLSVSPMCTATSGLIYLAGHPVCKQCAYETGKDKRCCRGNGLTLRQSCMDCSLFGSAVDP